MPLRRPVKTSVQRHLRFVTRLLCPELERLCISCLMPLFRRG
jgi:hypothetical protein